MAKGDVYTDLDNLRSEYSYKIHRYIDILNTPCKKRNFYESKLNEYKYAYEKLDKIIRAFY